MKKCSTCEYWIGERPDSYPENYSSIIEGKCRWDPVHIFKMALDFCHNHGHYTVAQKEEEDENRSQ